MLNKAQLIGNLGQDPETRNTNSGNTVCNLSVATSHRGKTQAGEWEERTEWHRVVCFGRTAETCQKYLTKGRRVYVEGRIQTRNWDDNGVTKYTTEIIGERVLFLSNRTPDREGSYSEAPDAEVPF